MEDYISIQKVSKVELLRNQDNILVQKVAEVVGLEKEGKPCPKVQPWCHAMLNFSLCLSCLLPWSTRHLWMTMSWHKCQKGSGKLLLPACWHWVSFCGNCFQLLAQWSLWQLCTVRLVRFIEPVNSWENTLREMPSFVQKLLIQGGDLKKLHLFVAKSERQKTA